MLDIVDASRQGQEGLSPRASQGLVAAARAWALIAGRDHVVIDDVQAVLPSVVEHRLDAGCPSHAGTPLSVELLERVNAFRSLPSHRLSRQRSRQCLQNYYRLHNPRSPLTDERMLFNCHLDHSLELN